MKFKLLIIFCFLSLTGYTQIDTTFLDFKFSESKNQILVKNTNGILLCKIEDVSNILLLSRSLCDLVSKNVFLGNKKYTKSIKVLSDIFLTPLLPFINENDFLLIKLDTALLNIPFELLTANDIPLSIVHPMEFRLEDSDCHSAQQTTRKSRIIGISDKSADPQRAVKQVAQLFESSTYYSKDQIKPLEINAELDILLISAHGYVDHQLKGILGWNKNRLSYEKLELLNPHLVYFDACQQGINKNYLDVLSNNETCNTYLGPITSNESGNSSTKTMTSFFNAILTGEFPSIALWKTKQSLVKKFKYANDIKLAYRALQFRLYTI